jgi:hypothetical protein
MRLTAFPTETVSVVPAHVSVDHALAGRGDRHEHHFFVACRTTRENRWDAVRRYAYCRHVRTSLVPVCGGLPYHNGRMQNKFRLGHGFFKLKLGHCEIQLRPLGVKTGQCRGHHRRHADNADQKRCPRGVPSFSPHQRTINPQSQQWCKTLLTTSASAASTVSKRFPTKSAGAGSVAQTR